MSETNINLGPVSAYALAKTKGYTGTEAEFAQLMANYATVGQQAAQSAAIASTAANTANTKASEAATSANNAATSATNASRSATAASQSATAASNSASSAATSAQTANAKSTEATNSANAASQSAGSASQYSQQALTARTAAQAAQTAAESAKTAAEAAAAESRADYTTLNTKVDNTKTALEAEIDAVADDVADLDTAVQSKASTTALQAETARATAEEARIEALFTAPTEEAVADWLEAHPEATTTVQDGAISYAKLDSTLKAKADDVDDLKSSLYGFNAQTKSALLALLQKVAYIDTDGQELYDALEDALYPPTDVDYITAVFTQSGTVYDTDSLDVLRPDLAVAAHYSDGTSETITSYVLSGTLVEGTSVITVAYGGKTVTFNVVVTTNRHIPSLYTWLYDAREGELLSEQNYVTKETGGQGGTETLVNNELVLTTQLSTGTASSNFLRYLLSDSTTTNGKLSCRAKFASGQESLATTGSSGFRLQLSNGTSGGQAFFLNNNGNITVIYFEGSTRKTIATNYAFDDYHVYEVELANGIQKFSIDGTQIFSSNTLSTNYCTANAILNQASTERYNPNGVTTNIDWIAYYEAA